MSTKIYDAYRLPKKVDLFVFTSRLRELADPIRDRLDAAAILDAAVKWHDAYRFGMLADGDPAAALLSSNRWSPWLAATCEWDDRQLSANPRHAGHDPHRLEVTFLNDPKQRGHFVGVKFFMDRPTDYAPMVEALMSEFGMTEYEYWDNTDLPEGLSRSQWRQRQEFWDRVIGDRGVWLDRGLSFQLRGSPMIHTSLAHAVNSGLVDLAAVSDPQRARALARRLVASVIPADMPADAKMRAVMHVVNHKTDDYADLVAEVARRLSPVTVESLADPQPAPVAPPVLDTTVLRLAEEAWSRLEETL